MAHPKRSETYYDEEAQVYSQKRYPTILQNYIQFLFTKRRTFVMRFIKRVIEDSKQPRTLFEMGCADGVLLRTITEQFPHAFSRLVGSDVSEQMLAQGRLLTADSSITYIARPELASRGEFTCALEIGVGALVLDTRGELAILANQLTSGGFLICSIAGRDSFAALRGSTAADRSLLRTYAEYEKDMATLFTLHASVGCGIAVPLLWKWPALARLLQPLMEVVGYIAPERVHERVYLLEKK